jgi:hypothetical protein
MQTTLVPQRHRTRGSTGPSNRRVYDQEDMCRVETLQAAGERLRIVIDRPSLPRALVVMLYAGKASSRIASANYFCRKLWKLGYATALIDIAPHRHRHSADTFHRHTDLVHRVARVAEWLESEAPCGPIPLVCVAAGELASEATMAVAGHATFCALVTLRGPRDLARSANQDACPIPALAIVGGNSSDTTAPNRGDGSADCQCSRSSLVRTLGGTFDQPAELSQAVSLCTDWLETTIPRQAPSSR